MDAYEERVVSNVIAEANVDEVGLWLVIKMVETEAGLTDAAQRREATLNCVRRVLDGGAVVAGYYRPDGSGIVPWQMSTSEILAKIRSEWDSLGRDPNIGEVVLFARPGLFQKT